MKNAQCAETNEKLIFRFLVFEIWSLKILRITKDAQCSETDFVAYNFFSGLLVLEI